MDRSVLFGNDFLTSANPKPAFDRPDLLVTNSGVNCNALSVTFRIAECTSST